MNPNLGKSIRKLYAIWFLMYCKNLQSSIEAQISSRQPRHTIMQRNQIGTRNIDKQVFNQHVASSTDKYTFSGKFLVFLCVCNHFCLK